ncbi:hypothetical protein MM300_16210 [Evansella sp. LMS18]|uniref:hypothetical protein n=1 Tax=Evansella sp. LMS18 TaxID=2924033 RepID=UPI0020D0FF28|nr:hypothetical protein [Evansella sp. LMS18]UTR09428.1 hypothetical protein MM300_16210 [Evansella sp. LMS18]
MKSIKLIIFIVGLFLINYIGGVPQDSKNLFITHTVFFAPILVEYYKLLKVKNFLKFFIYPIWIAGIMVITANILGIAGVITVTEAYRVIFNPEYFSIFSLNLYVTNYLLVLGIVYAAVFVGRLTFEPWIDWEPVGSQKKTKEEMV